MKFPTVVLENGLRVANFSSPHEFKFDDGTVLPACSPEHARELMLEAQERVHTVDVNGIIINDIDLSFEMSGSVLRALNECSHLKDIDIAIVPLPVLQLVREISFDGPVMFRGIRVADRVLKTVSSNKF